MVTKLRDMKKGMVEVLYPGHTRMWYSGSLFDSF